LSIPTGDSHTIVYLVFADFLRTQGFRQIDHAITLKLDAADLAEQIRKLFDIGIAESRKIRIPGDAVILPFPDQKQTGPFKNERSL